MPKVIITVGRICSGKSTYCKRLAKEINAVIFSVDELTLTLLGQQAGDKLSEYVEKLEAYFLQKAVQTVHNGVNVIIDIGLWTRGERDEVRAFFKERNIPLELHCIDIDDNEWQRRIDERNADIKANGRADYFVDEGLAKKAAALFEPIGEDEKDVIYIKDQRRE
ncbi:MAG: ATP-binding protein [Ruminococcus sp.]|nr:ATP-binding protein [Ruminococcus sp.]